MVVDYIKQALVSENPVKSLNHYKNDFDYINAVYDDIAVEIEYLIEDGMSPPHALFYVLKNEFGVEDIDKHKFQNCLTRISIIQTIIEENPEKDLKK